jgi:hypothetical protein
MTAENGTFNNNDRQKNFNQIRGVIHEFLPGEKFGSVTLELGHEKKRFVNLVIKKTDYQRVTSHFKIGDKVVVKFYITSKKNTSGHWATMATILEIEACK